jgi:hypothetical protein
MIPNSADSRQEGSLANHMRRRRMRLLAKIIEHMPEDPVSILDIGGTACFWKNAASEFLPRCRITLMNLSIEPTDGLPNVHSLVGDARRMSEFCDRSFDLCFSNSVIEHVGTLYDQKLMAHEIRRVGRGYFVQTPNRYFPLEPHFLMPFWSWWPIWLRVSLYRRVPLGWMGKQPDQYIARADIEQIRLMNSQEMRWLFPDAQIHREKFGPLTKSIIAVREP